jgi:hypothetical protein
MAEDEGVEEDDETDWEILNDVTPQKLMAWEWISEGCYPYRSPD